MNKRILWMVVAILVLASAAMYGQMIKRTDVIWARNTAAPITLDGKLSEADWAKADSVKVKAGQSAGMPGSGWWWNFGAKPGSDPTDATIKFLAYKDTLYVAVVCKDKSVGAIADWAHFDEFIMNIRYPQPTGITGTPGRDGNTQQNFEYSYGFYCGADWGDTLAGKKGGKPGFMGFAGSQNQWPRSDSLKNIWNAVTTVQGTSNDDATPDTSWTTEIKFNIGYLGYKPQQTGGDIVMYNISIWDYDYAWPMDTVKNSSTTTWLQGVWGNASAYDHMRVYIKPEVTVNSGAAPTIGPDWTIPVATAGVATPVIDGKLNEPAWASANSLKIKYGDAATRAAYPGTMKWRSGQTQFQVNGATNPVLDPSLCTVKYFVKADTLYLGFDVADKFVRGLGDANRMDGIDVIFNDRGTLDGDSIYQRRDLQFRVDSAGATKRMGDLGIGAWDSSGTKVRVKIALKGGTTVDTLGTSADSGYTAEMAIDLTKLGYAHGLGDGVVFASFVLYDGDSFSGGSYGTKTWIGRPGGWDDGPAWFYVDPSVTLGVNGQASSAQPGEFVLLGNYPNPFNPTTNIRFQLGHQSEIQFDVFDVLGRVVSSQSLGVLQAGSHSTNFNATNLASGSYFYRLTMKSNGATQIGRMMLLK